LVVYQGGAVPAVADHAGVVAGEVVPDDHDALGVEAEGHGPFHCRSSAVAGLTDAGDLFGDFERDLDGPAGGVAFHDVGNRCREVGGDQREVRSAGFGDDQHPDRAGAEHTAPQAPLVMRGDSGSAAVAGDGDRCGG
jgi:hypothetical protein